MISSISTATTAQQPIQQPQPASAPASSSAGNLAPDTVKISPQGQAAASAEVDHDGDGH